MYSFLRTAQILSDILYQPRAYIVKLALSFASFNLGSSTLYSNMISCKSRSSQSVARISRSGSDMLMLFG